jgi:Lrp/AsnC family transcriptional regulator for asnA, asnC and gidA
VCSDNQHLLALLSDKLSTIEGVRETVTFLYLDIAKRAQEWRLPD